MRSECWFDCDVRLRSVEETKDIVGACDGSPRGRQIACYSAQFHGEPSSAGSVNHFVRCLSNSSEIVGEWAINENGWLFTN